MSRRIVLYWNEIQQSLIDHFMESHPDVAWTPDADVCASETEVLIRVEAAGVQAGDIQVYLDGLTLLISGERRDPYAKIFREGARMHQLEIMYGSFQRQVSLPYPVSGGSAKAVLQNGVLEIRLKRQEEPRQTPISVRVGKHK